LFHWVTCKWEGSYSLPWSEPYEGRAIKPFPWQGKSRGFYKGCYGEFVGYIIRFLKIKNSTILCIHITPSKGRPFYLDQPASCSLWPLSYREI
jgi:hypothetical protein